MKGFIGRFAAVVGMSVAVFELMQSFFDGLHSADFGEKYGFPFPYMQDGTFATKGHLLWSGFLGDIAISLTISALTMWVWHMLAMRILHSRRRA